MELNNDYEGWGDWKWIYMSNNREWGKGKVGNNESDNKAECSNWE